MEISTYTFAGRETKVVTFSLSGAVYVYSKYAGFATRSMNGINDLTLLLNKGA